MHVILLPEARLGFAQMTRMLDLLEDYLEMRGYNYDRIDGTTQWSERQVC